MQANNIKILEEFNDDLDNLCSSYQELQDTNEELQEKIGELEDKIIELENKDYGN